MENTFCFIFLVLGFTLLDFGRKTLDISDEKLLRYLHNDLVEKTKNKDWWDDLSPLLQDELDEAVEKSYEKTNWVSDDEARKQIQEWTKR